MSDGMTLEAFVQARWLAVYGAYVAAQVHQKMSLGISPDRDDMKRYVEEAAAIANMAALANGEPER